MVIWVCLLQNYFFPIFFLRSDDKRVYKMSRQIFKCSLITVPKIYIHIFPFSPKIPSIICKFRLKFGSCVCIFPFLNQIRLFLWPSLSWNLTGGSIMFPYTYLHILQQSLFFSYQGFLGARSPSLPWMYGTFHSISVSHFLNYNIHNASLSLFIFFFV